MQSFSKQKFFKKIVTKVGLTPKEKENYGSMKEDIQVQLKDQARVDFIKLFWSKYTYCFLQARLFENTKRCVLVILVK